MPNADAHTVKLWYGRSTWQNLRKLILHRDPICTTCNRNPSTEVDHVVPHKGDWNLFVDAKNLAGICKPCHSEKTAAEDQGFSNPRKLNPSPRVQPTGLSGKNFVSTSVGSAVDKALDFNVDELLEGI